MITKSVIKDSKHCLHSHAILCMIVLALKNRALQKSATNNRSFKCKKVFAFVLFIGRTFYVVMYDD
jgi:hypothetical protein